MITCVVMRTQDTVNLIFLGHLDGNNKLLAGIGLGTAFTNIFGMFVIIGMNMAMDTLVS